MRAVWSFWSKPFHAQYRGWCSALHHLLAWGLSFRAASAHYPDTVLVTDRAGKKLLVDQLGLPFTHVSTELERIREAHEGWWTLGKIVTYGLQDQPFVHLDTDVFLWKRLPPMLERAPVLSQCPERFDDTHCFYRPGNVEWAFAACGLRLPIEWEWARSKGAPYTAENCGILGGTAVPFFRHFSRLAVELLTHPQNAPAWARLNNKTADAVLVEQFLVSACVDYHRFNPESPYRGVSGRRLFPSDRGIDPYSAAQMGYTHLISGAKSHPAAGRRIEERLRREDPAFYRRCVRLTEGRHLVNSGA